VRLSPLRPGEVSHAPNGVARALASSGGAPLASSVREPLEESLGVDLDPVRIHQGPDAAALVRLQSGPQQRRLARARFPIRR
jgi:hypothetical protein